MEEEKKGPCAVCVKPADLKCTGCREVFYCNRDCQRRHWKKHKSECRPVPYAVVTAEDDLGRHLVASRDLREGEVVFSESPLVVGPVAVTPPVCLACYALVDGSYKCRKSGWPMCGAECEAAAAHNPEVVIPSQTEGTFEIEDYSNNCYLYECVAPLRALLMQKTSLNKFKKILNLQSHVKERRGTEAWSNCQEKIIDVMKKTLGVMVFEVLYPQLDFSDDLIQRIAGIFDTNAIEIRLTQTEVMALYETACLLEHSCVPNVKMNFDKKFNITVRAGRAISKGEHLSIMYTHSLWGTHSRREHLSNAKKFWCRCFRCADPTECGTNFSTLLRSGKELRSRDPLDQMAAWASADGTELVEAGEVAEENAKIAAELGILQIKGTVEDYLEFLEKHSSTLHQSHFHMVTAKHSLLQMLGRTEGHLIQEMPEEELKRKEELCREVIALCKRLDPCSARLQIYAGVAMYELHLPLLQYGKRAWEAGTMATEEFRESLVEPRGLLLDALEMLKDETHEDLPEGQLRLQVKDTLAQLESFMKTIGYEF